MQAPIEFEHAISSAIDNLLEVKTQCDIFNTQSKDLLLHNLLMASHKIDCAIRMIDKG